MAQLMAWVPYMSLPFFSEDWEAESVLGAEQELTRPEVQLLSIQDMLVKYGHPNEEEPDHLML